MIWTIFPCATIVFIVYKREGFPVKKKEHPFSNTWIFQYEFVNALVLKQWQGLASVPEQVLP